MLRIADLISRIIMQITVAQDSHVPGIVEVWEEFSLFHEDIDPRYPVVDNVRSGYEEHLRNLMADADTLVLVALDNRKVVGLCIAQVKNSSPAFKRERFGFIDELAVKAEYRRRGIGTRILGKILDWFKSRNIDMIELDVAAANPVGYPFWEKHGFKAYVHRLYMKT